jgi:hypothetical protein
MRREVTVLALMAAMVAGCAHNKANQYAYAPPLAPPVYPQPQIPGQQVVAAPVVGMPEAVPGMVAAAPPMAVSGMPGMPAGVAGDPCCPPMDGGAVPVVYESAVQTPACPPGP